MATTSVPRRTTLLAVTMVMGPVVVAVLGSMATAVTVTITVFWRCATAGGVSALLLPRGLKGLCVRRVVAAIVVEEAESTSGVFTRPSAANVCVWQRRRG